MGLGAIAVAQTPSSSAPFPDLPPIPSAATPAKPAAAPQSLAAARPASPAKPQTTATTTPATATTPATTSNSATPAASPTALPALPALPGAAPVAPVNPVPGLASDTAAPATTADNTVKLPAPDMPSTTNPPAGSDTTAAAPANPDLIVNPSAAQQAPIAPPPMETATLPVPPLPDGATTSLPQVNVSAEEVKPKSWEAKLEPSYTYPETNFHYRRVLLPSTIYASHYNDENKHLPIRMTRKDYENLLFYSATKNDITAMRALINQGTDINAKDTRGATVLTAAREAGADAAVRFLVARGAKS